MFNNKKYRWYNYFINKKKRNDIGKANGNRLCPPPLFKHRILNNSGSTRIFVIGILKK